MTYTMKLLDIKKETYETTFGTCELCMFVGDHTDVDLVMDINGEKHTVPTGEWCYGDYFTYFYIDNTADFAHWLSTQEFDGESPHDGDDVLSAVKDAVELYHKHLYMNRLHDRGMKYYNVYIEVDVHTDYETPLYTDLCNEVTDYLKNKSNLYEESDFYMFGGYPFEVKLPDGKREPRYSFTTDSMEAASLDDIRDTAQYIEDMVRVIVGDDITIVTEMDYSDEDGEHHMYL